MVTVISIHLNNYFFYNHWLFWKETKQNCESTSKEKCNTTSYYFNAMVSFVIVYKQNYHCWYDTLHILGMYNTCDEVERVRNGTVHLNEIVSIWPSVECQDFSGLVSIWWKHRLSWVKTTFIVNIWKILSVTSYCAVPKFDSELFVNRFRGVWVHGPSLCTAEIYGFLFQPCNLLNHQANFFFQTKITEPIKAKCFHHVDINADIVNLCMNLLNGFYTMAASVLDGVTTIILRSP